MAFGAARTPHLTYRPLLNPFFRTSTAFHSKLKRLTLCPTLSQHHTRYCVSSRAPNPSQMPFQQSHTCWVAGGAPASPS